MRFSQAYSRPSLTPLGERLLHISERKLYDLEYPSGQRESGVTLYRGVLVRETVRSAWLAVQQGHQAEVNDWTSTNALGLDVIGEEEEEEAARMEQKEEKWFEDLLAELGEDDEEEDEVVEDLEVDEGYEGSEDPLTPYISTLLPVDEQVSPLMISRLELPVDEDVVEDVTVGVQEVLAVDDEDDFEDDLSLAQSLSSVSPSPPSSSPILPVDCSSSPYSHLDPLQQFEDDDDFSLPPLLHRSWSSDSSDSIGSPECTTPTFGCVVFDDVREMSSVKAGGSEEGEEEEDYGWSNKDIRGHPLSLARMEGIRGF